MPSLTPLANSLNAAVVAHRRLMILTKAVHEDLTPGDYDLTVWLPVLSADRRRLAALYAAAASSPPDCWAVWTPADRGRAAALDAYMSGETVREQFGLHFHVPVFGPDGQVKLVVTLCGANDPPKDSVAGDLYRAIGRSELLEPVDDFQHCPALLRALVASHSEVRQLRITRVQPATLCPRVTRTV